MCTEIEDLTTGTHEVKRIYQEEMKQCLKRTRIGLTCVITRTVFMSHLLLLVWKCWQLYTENNWMWWLTVPLVAMLGELTVVLYKRDGHEWRRFCPSYFFYLLGAVPAVWCIELDRIQVLRADEDSARNQTSSAGLGFAGFSLQTTMTTTEWALALEQSMMFLLIIGRWMLPKGEMSREQLSQLLLVYLGMAIDIIELFEIFKEPRVLRDLTFVYIVLAAFSWSLLQFTFLLTPPPKVRRPTRSQVVDLEVARNWDKQPDKIKTDRFSFIYDEKFGIFVSLFMQDVPFLAIRIVSIAHYQVYSYANTFFTVKNALMVIFQLYRLLVLACDKCCAQDDPDDENSVEDNKKNEEKSPSGGVSDSVNRQIKDGAQVSVAIQVSDGVNVDELSAEKETQGVILPNGVGDGDGKTTDVPLKPPRPSTGKRVTIAARPTTAIIGGRPTSARPGSARPGSARPGLRPVSGRPRTPGVLIDNAVSDDSGIGNEGGDKEPLENGQEDPNDNSMNNSDLDIGRPTSRGPIFFSDEKPQSALRRSVTPSRKSVTFFDDGSDSPVPTLERRSVTPRPHTPGPGGRTPTPSRSRPCTPGPRSISAASGRRSVSFAIADDDEDEDENEGDDFSRGSPSSVTTYRTELRSVTPSRKSVSFMDGTIDNEGRAPSRMSRPATPVHTKQKQLQKVLGRRGVAKHKPVSTPAKKK